MLGAEDTTSPYSLSWNTTTATNGTHTLAARARDAAGNIGDSAPTAVIVDNQPPVGTVQINGGAAATNSRTVTLSLSATDALSNVTADAFFQQRDFVFCGGKLRANEDVDAIERRGHQDRLRTIPRCRRKLVLLGDRHHRVRHYCANDFLAYGDEYHGQFRHDHLDNQ